MNQITLDEYRCRKCGRLFYINGAERSSLDLDFGCPYGCDDNGDRIRALTAGAEEAVEGSAAGITDHRIVIELSEGDFESSMARKPRDQEEFDDWAYLVEKGLVNGHIDWDIVYECARDAMPGDEDE